MVSRSGVLAGLVWVFSGFWLLVGVSLLVIAPFAGSFSDDDSATDERQTMIALAAIGVGVLAAAGGTATVGTSHRRNRPRARLWTVVLFAVWAAVFLGFVVTTATSGEMRSDDEDTRGGAHSDLAIGAVNLASCLVILTVAALPPSGRQAEEPTATGSGTATATSAKAGATAGAVMAVVTVVLDNPWSLIIPVWVGVAAGLAALVGAGVGSLVASVTQADAAGRLALRSHLAATWTVAVLLALVGRGDPALVTLLLSAAACSVLWSVTSSS